MTSRNGIRSKANGTCALESYYQAVTRTRRCKRQGLFHLERISAPELHTVPPHSVRCVVDGTSATIAFVLAIIDGCLGYDAVAVIRKRVLTKQLPSSPHS